MANQALTLGLNQVILRPAHNPYTLVLGAVPESVDSMDPWALAEPPNKLKARPTTLRLVVKAITTNNIKGLSTGTEPPRQDEARQR